MALLDDIKATDNIDEEYSNEDDLIPTNGRSMRLEMYADGHEDEATEMLD